MDTTRRGLFGWLGLGAAAGVVYANKPAADPAPVIVEGAVPRFEVCVSAYAMPIKVSAGTDLTALFGAGGAYIALSTASDDEGEDIPDEYGDDDYRDERGD